MPPPARPKPPAETKAQLMLSVKDAIEAKFPVNPAAAVEYLLNFFTAVDLVGIRADLERK